MTQLIKVENTAQGTKPRECLTVCSVCGDETPTGIPLSGQRTDLTCSTCDPAFAPLRSAVALKLKLLYTPEGALEQVTEVTDVRNFPPTL